MHPAWEAVAMTTEQDEALEVLRAVWRGQGQAAQDLDDAGGTGKSCKRMTDAGVGFEDFADGEADLQDAWRATLATEGKLRPAGGSVRDLVLGPAESRSR
jgi:hypothetical protein